MFSRAYQDEDAAAVEDTEPAPPAQIHQVSIPPHGAWCSSTAEWLKTSLRPETVLLLPLVAVMLVLLVLLITLMIVTADSFITHARACADICYRSAPCIYDL